MADQPREVLYLSPTGIEIKPISTPYKSTASQSLICVLYSGINPADIKHVTLGLHSSVAGYDFSGKVIAAGPSSRFSIGDKICGNNLPGPERDMWKGAHQDFAIAEGEDFYNVPTGVGMHVAAALPVVTQTAADGLFNVLGLGFPAASLAGVEKQSVLIWGAGGAVGVSAVQLARAAGHGPIFLTASAKHHDKLKELGADVCVDYRDEDVVEQLKREFGTRGVTPRCAFDTVGAGVFGPDHEAGKSSPALVARSLEQEGGGHHADAKFACVLPVRGDQRWKMVAAVRDKNFTMFGGLESKDWPVRIRKSMAWVLENYGTGRFVVPNVRVVKGIEEAVKGLEQSASGQLSLEKIVVEHPISRI